jgi:hypothetical protein
MLPDILRLEHQLTPLTPPFLPEESPEAGSSKVVALCLKAGISSKITRQQCVAPGFVVRDVTPALYANAPHRALALTLPSCSLITGLL